jgi:c-di-GMP-binding flagellar brake protein YcgR
MNSKLEQELKDLYHGKHHRGIEPRFYNSVKEGKVEARRKVKDYEKEVLEKFKPNIDPLKRSKLQEYIFDLQLREEKNKRKVVLEDGSFVL